MALYRTSKLNFVLGSKQLMIVTLLFMGKVFRASDVSKTGFLGTSLVSSNFGQLGRLWFKQTPNCLLYLRRFDHMGGLKQTPINSLLTSAKTRCCAHLCSKQQLMKMGFSGPSNYLLSSRFGYVDVTRRYYCVDRKQVYHFKQKNYNWNHPLIAAAALAGFISLTYLSNLETIPYSKRTRLVLVPRKFEKMLGRLQFEFLKAEHEGEVLPASHPTSKRVRLIAPNVIKALQRGLKDDNVWGTGELFDHGSSRAKRYMEHVDWEVIVVDKPIPYACCYLGGKIVVYTGAIRNMKSDAEIAVTISHEVAHAVARHVAEMITGDLGFQFFGLLLLSMFGFSVLEDISYLLAGLPLSRKVELEAEYIGLLLMASAGYDPRVALTVRGRYEDDYSGWTSFLSTHPSRREILECTNQALEEAMNLYRESLSTGVERQ